MQVSNDNVSAIGSVVTWSDYTVFPPTAQTSSTTPWVSFNINKTARWVRVRREEPGSLQLGEVQVMGK